MVKDKKAIPIQPPSPVSVGVLNSYSTVLHSENISGKPIRNFIVCILSKETLLCEWDLTVWSMESILTTTRCHVMCSWSDRSRFEEHMHQRLWIVDQLLVVLETMSEEAIGIGRAWARACEWWWALLEWQWQRRHMIDGLWRGGHERQIWRWWRRGVVVVVVVVVLLHHGVRVSPHYHIKHLVFEAT